MFLYSFHGNADLFIYSKVQVAAYKMDVDYPACDLSAYMSPRPSHPIARSSLSFWTGVQQRSININIRVSLDESGRIL